MSDCPSPHSEGRTTDRAVIELLRKDGPLGIGELASALGVTATAVRQRLDRLMRQGLVSRQPIGGRRGRPAHAYSLSEAGRRQSGDNFRDLAIVLWREVRGVKDPEVRRGLLGRIGVALAGLQRSEIRGSLPAERLQGVAEIMRRNDIACAVEAAPDAALPVLTSYACPYPDLAEEDRGVCAAERVMIEELVGVPVALAECRLDGGGCCRFSLGPAAAAGSGSTATLVPHLQSSP